jgi:DNA-binding beta-propeller fold protein YncE
MAVVDEDLVYFVNSFAPRVYRLIGSYKTDYVLDGVPHDATEPYDRLHYPISGPSGIAYAPRSDSLVFADTGNDRIMELRFSDLDIVRLVADAGGAPFTEGADPLAMAPVRPNAVEYNPFTGKVFFVEEERHRVLHVDSSNRSGPSPAPAWPASPGTAAPRRRRGCATPARSRSIPAGTPTSPTAANHAIRMVVGGALP